MLLTLVQQQISPHIQCQSRKFYYIKVNINKIRLKIALKMVERCLRIIILKKKTHKPLT